MEQVILSSIKLEDLEKLFRSIVKEELEKKNSAESLEGLISADKARGFFEPKVSTTTFWRWVKEGHIRPHVIAGKNYYKRSELLEAAKVLKKYKTVA